jgi:predicted metalloendopeptidase
VGRWQNSPGQADSVFAAEQSDVDLIIETLLAPATDTHSPARFRAIGPVRNIDAWYRAFDVQPGDHFYLAPEKRVHIW